MKVLDLKEKLERLNPDIKIGFYHREVASIDNKKFPKQGFGIPNNFIFFYKHPDYQTYLKVSHRSLSTLKELLTKKGWIKPWQAKELNE